LKLFGLLNKIQKPTNKQIRKIMGKKKKKKETSVPQATPCTPKKQFICQRCGDCCINSTPAFTKEEYKVGQLTTIRDNFRTYRDMRQCVFNFYEILNSSVYKKVIETYYDKQMRLIKECKYMTSSHEVETVIKIIQKYNLTYYDEQVVKQNSCPRYIKGNNYTLQANMYIRESPNGHYIKEATSDAKAHMDIFPILKKGTKITCRDVQVYEGATWVKCPSGWICGIGASGKIYIS
jgi:hypothetical protein